MTLLEVAKHALEAMEDAMYRADTHEFYDAKESLRYAIEQAEQAEQEPVAWVEPKWLDPDTRGWPSDSFESVPIEGWLPLYTAPTPRQWVSLTEQEMYDLFFHDQYGPRLPEYLVNTIKCIEAALKEKNA